MTTWYLDTSAALKLILYEAESEALIGAITAVGPTLAASFLLETELRRAVHRVPALSQQLITSILDRVDLYEVSPAIIRQAGLLPGEHLRSLDALHLATAIAIGADEVLTYDRRLAEAAGAVGMAVSAPQ